MKKLYSGLANFIDWYKNKFPENNNEITGKWLSRLKEKQLNHMHYITLEIKKADVFSLIVELKNYDKKIAFPD